MQNVKAEIVNGTNKNGQPYEAIRFSILTSQGEYKTGLIFPTSLEINLIKQAISPMNGIYSGDTSPKNEGF